MTGLIDIGGGMRDVYGTGVTDCFLDKGVSFDVCIGVSAGGANLASFLSGQRGRNYRFYTDYAAREEYMGFKSYIKNGSYINLDYIYSTLSNTGCEDPLDYEALCGSSTRLVIVATEAATGEARYFTKEDMAKDDFWLLKATSALPVVCRPCRWMDDYYFDGGVSDPIPVEKALDMGCDRLVVIIPRPATEKKPMLTYLVKPFLKDYPKTLEKIKRYHEIYNEKLHKLKELERQGRAIIISPDSDKGLSTLTRDRSRLTEYYQKAYKDAEYAVERFSLLAP